LRPVDQALESYFAAWNEQDAEARRRLLERSLTSDVELVDPTGLARGIREVGERIGRYHASAPGTEVVPGSGLDAHHDVVRYAWKIVDEGGSEVMEGLDVATRAEDGRLRRIVMFLGPLPPMH
jgi:hypothetical protein